MDASVCLCAEAIYAQTSSGQYGFFPSISGLGDQAVLAGKPTNYLGSWDGRQIEGDKLVHFSIL